MNKSLLLIAFLFVGMSIINAQNINPGENEVYRLNEISRIELNMSEEDKNELIYGDNPEARIYFPAQIRFVNSVVDETRPIVGIRNRGNTSIDNHKRPLKIDFKEYGGLQNNYC